MKKKILGLLLAVLLVTGISQVAPKTAYADSLLTSTWHFTPNNGSSELYQNLASNALSGKISLTVVYDLHGACILGGDASALIFDQNGWQFTSLSSYGQNCFNGQQTVTIPLSAFGSLNTNTALTGSFHARFWTSTAQIIDIYSVVSNAAANPSWPIQSVDVMKYSKDVVCNQPTQSFVDQEVQKAVDIGANYVAVTGYYDNPSCGNSTTLTTTWVNSTRAHGLKVWFRMKDLSFEGDYNVAKNVSPDGMRHQKLMNDWIAAHPSLFVSGDIFTPDAEPQNGGINGVTYCAQNNYCQFTNAADFNLWLRQTQTFAVLDFAAIGKTGIKVGYYGFDGFVAAGIGNPDWQGHSFLEASTIALMGEVAVDHYPETIGHTMAQDLATMHQALGASTPIILSEWGTITTNGAIDTQVNNTLGAAHADAGVVGVNYWTMGPSGNEALINSDFTNRANFAAVKAFFKP